MIRSWGIVALTGAAQPWFGAVTTGPVALVNPSNGEISVPLSVADSKKFLSGDRVAIDPQVLISGVSITDILLIDRTDTTAGVLYCRSEGGALTHTHASGVILQLSIACMDVIIQTNAAAVAWLGSDNTVVAAGGSAFYQLQPATAPAAPNVFRLAGQAGNTNVCRTSDGWMIGTAAQTVSVSAIVL